MQRARGFTLIEIALSIFILLLLLMLAVPSFTGVIANRRLKQSLDEFNNLVRQAQERSVAERRSYLIVWSKNNVAVRPEAFAENEEVKAKAEFRPRNDRERHPPARSQACRNSTSLGEAL